MLHVTSNVTSLRKGSYLALMLPNLLRQESEELFWKRLPRRSTLPGLMMTSLDILSWKEGVVEPTVVTVVKVVMVVLKIMFETRKNNGETTNI